MVSPLAALIVGLSTAVGGMSRFTFFLARAARDVGVSSKEFEQALSLAAGATVTAGSNITRTLEEPARVWANTLTFLSKRAENFSANLQTIIRTLGDFNPAGFIGGSKTRVEETTRLQRMGRQVIATTSFPELQNVVSNMRGVEGLSVTIQKAFTDIVKKQQEIIQKEKDLVAVRRMVSETGLGQRAVISLERELVVLRKESAKIGLTSEMRIRPSGGFTERSSEFQLRQIEGQVRSTTTFEGLRNAIKVISETEDLSDKSLKSFTAIVLEQRAIIQQEKDLVALRSVGAKIASATEQFRREDLGIFGRLAEDFKKLRAATVLGILPSRGEVGFRRGLVRGAAAEIAREQKDEDKRRPGLGLTSLIGLQRDFITSQKDKDEPKKADIKAIEAAILRSIDVEKIGFESITKEIRTLDVRGGVGP